MPSSILRLWELSPRSSLKLAGSGSQNLAHEFVQRKVLSYISSLSRFREAHRDAWDSRAAGDHMEDGEPRRETLGFIYRALNAIPERTLEPQRQRRKQPFRQEAWNPDLRINYG